MVTAICATIFTACTQKTEAETPEKKGDDKKSVTYVTLRQLSDSASVNPTSFDGLKIRNAIVTKVWNSYAHLEDSTAAILLYASGHGLKEGNCINGEISGTIQLCDGNATVQDTDKAFAEITALDYSKATISSVVEDSYPLSAITIHEYLANYRKYFNRRILFSNVNVASGISSSGQSGTISQSESSLTVFNKSGAAVIGTGKTGDLICFPSVFKSTLQALVYTGDQFCESDWTEDTPFTRITLSGAYSSTDSETPAAVRTYEAGADQISCSKGSSSRKWSIFNPAAGTYLTVSLPVVSLNTGAVINAGVTINGDAKNYNVTVVKMAGSKAWLEDKTNNKGFIITLQP